MLGQLRRGSGSAKPSPAQFTVAVKYGVSYVLLPAAQVHGAHHVMGRVCATFELMCADFEWGA